MFKKKRSIQNYRGVGMKGMLRHSILACGLSLLSLGVASPAFANSGGKEYPDVPLPGEKSYIGSYHKDGDATGGKVTVDGGFDGDVSGGYSGKGDVNDNTLNISGGNVTGDAYGAYSWEGNATGNTVNISGGNFNARKSVYGGYARKGNAIGNTVNITGGNLGGDVYGGSTFGGNADGNVVNMSGGETSGDVVGGYSWDGNANGNTVTMSGGKVGRDLVGGWAGGWVGNADNNTVTMSGGKVEKDVVGGYSADGVADNNTVIISGGDVGRDIFGGYSNENGATGNKVYISGGHVGRDIYGGYGRTGLGATGNTVHISGTPGFGPNTHFYGGWAGNGADDYSGNTLEIYTDDVHVKGAGNFQHWRFGVGKDSVGKTMLWTDDPVTMTKKGKADADLGLEFRDRSKMGVGDNVTLMNKTDGGDFDINGKKFKEGDNDHLNVHQDSGLRGRDYDFHVKRDAGGDHKIDVTVDHVTDDYLNPQSESVLIARSVELAVLEKGGDFIANEGMDQARFGSGLSSGDIDEVHGSVFGAITGGHLNYRLDGRTTVNGLLLLGGYGVGIPLPQGQALVGVFAEGGWSSYKGRSNQGVNSHGTSRYFGGGVLTRYELSGFYVEGSGRVGRSENHYNSDLTDSTGESASDKTNNTYYGLHAGVGYVLDLGNGISIDPSTKYFWTHQTGSNVSILGDPVRFGATNSQRWRTGARVDVEVMPGVAPYVGGYYEHEFDGKVRGTDYGFEIASPSLKGDTGIAEVGVTFGAPTDAFKVDLGVQGYAGKRSGVIGSLKAKWLF